MFRWVGDQRIQMLLLATRDKPVLRHHVRSTTEKDAARLTLAGDELGDLVWDISYCLVYLCLRFAILSVTLQQLLEGELFVVG